MDCEHAARVEVLERKLRSQRERSRMLKARLREEQARTAGLQATNAQLERIWHSYLERNSFRHLFTLYANVQAAARMMGMSVEQFAACAETLSLGEIRRMVVDLETKPKL